MTVLPDSDLGMLILLGTMTMTVLSLGAEPLVRRGTRRARDTVSAQSSLNLRRRVRAWWGTWIFAIITLLVGHWAVVAMFAVLSFLALREFITLAPTRRGDHLSLVVAFFVIGPLQFALVGLGRIEWLLALIPIYAFVGLATAAAIRSSPDEFLERTATIQWALLACVFGLSCVPALLWAETGGDERTLVVMLVGVVLVADVFRVVYAQPVGGHVVNKSVSGSRTWEGGVIGLATGVAFAAAVAPYTPLSTVDAIATAAVAVSAGFAGGFALAAIRTERTGTIIARRRQGARVEVSGAVLSHLGSLLFAAPVFFHLVLLIGE